MSQPIIVEGDPTSTGGRMIPTQTSRKSNGKSVIRLGDKYFCPACKGMGSVVQASSLQFINSAGVAYHGCKVQCGCSGNQIVMATQSTDLVDTGGGAVAVNNPVSAIAAAIEEILFDRFFQIKHKDTGEILAGISYKITLADGTTIKGVSDESGHTQKISATSQLTASIEVPYYDPDYTSPTDTHRGSDTCHC